jgi:hypothetical protein
MAMTKNKSSIYCCRGEGHYGVSLYRADPESSQWILQVTALQGCEQGSSYFDPGYRGFTLLQTYIEETL